MLREMRSNALPALVVPLIFSLKGREGGVNEATKRVPLVSGVRGTFLMCSPYLVMSSRTTVFFWTLWYPASVNTS